MIDDLVQRLHALERTVEQLVTRETPIAGVAGLTRIGTHPTYGSAYSAFWREGTDYALLTDGNSVWLNAPNAASNIYLRAGNNERVTITPTSTTISTTLVTSDKLFLNGAGVDGNIAAHIRGVGTTGGTRGLRVVNSSGAVTFDIYDNGQCNLVGNTGVGSGPAGDTRLYVKGSGTSSSTFGLTVAQSTGGLNFYARDDGYLWANRAWAIPSDEDVKDAIDDLPHGLASLRQVRPTQYHRKNDKPVKGKKRRTEYGFIAQDVRKVLPDVVSNAAMDGEAELLALDYNAFIPILVNAVRELDTHAAALEATVTQQAATIAALEARLTALEAR